MAQQPNPSLGTLTGPAKLEAVTGLVDKLTRDLSQTNMLPHQRDAALEELKVYGRDPRNSDPIFTKKGIETLTRHAFDSSSSTTSRNAMRCLANAMLINPKTRQMFVDLEYEAKACGKLKNDNRDDEFLVSRILFLTTYETNINLLTLITKHHLAETVVQNLARHADHFSRKGASPNVDPMAGMAITETAKLLFNVTHFCPEKASAFAPAIPHILTVLCKRDLPATKPLDPPFGSLVNVLLNLDLAGADAATALYPKGAPDTVVERLIQLLDLSLRKYGDDDVEQTVTPLIGVIRIIHETAPAGVQKYLRGKLLPTEEDRREVLGRGDSLSARLLRNSANPITPEFRKASSHLLFDMSDKDASKFVQNVGYGFASGFLFQNDIPVPEAASQPYRTGITDAGARPINPITGQFADLESHPDLPEMTDEEKEREAERLFVLFERLKRTGIVSVENPVETAFREGRVQEIDDDDRVEELD